MLSIGSLPPSSLNVPKLGAYLSLNLPVGVAALAFGAIDVTATAAAADTQLPWAVTLHGVIWRESGLTHTSPTRWLRGRFFARQAYRQLLGVPNVFVISDYAAAMLPPDRPYRTFRINNPVGEEIFSLRNRPTSPHILVVGGLRHRKDPLAAIQVFEHVVAAVKQVIPPECAIEFHGHNDVGCAVANPWFGDEATDELRRAFENGLRALFLYPPIQGFQLSDPLADFQVH